MNIKSTLAGVILVFVVLLVFMPTGFYATFDMAYWTNWCTYMFEHGISNVYDSDANYPPFVLYLLNLFAIFQGSVESINANIGYMKYIALCFDVIPFAVFIYLWKEGYIKNSTLFFLLFNVAYFYNTVVWGQVDSIHTNLCLLAFVVALQSPAASVILFTLALNTKVQSVIFLPVEAAIIFTQVKSIRQVGVLLLCIVGAEVLITLPFLLSGNFSKYLSIYFNSVDNQPKVSLNACNLWYLVFWNANPKEIYDGTTAFILSYKQWGLLLFMFSSLFCSIPFAVKTVQSFLEKKLPANYYELLFLTASMLTLSFFYFNTQMHERYIHPAVIFLFFYAAWSGKFWLYILISVAYLLGMEKVLDFSGISEALNNPWFMDRRFIALLFSAAIISGYYRVYFYFPVKNDWIRLTKHLIRRK